MNEDLQQARERAITTLGPIVSEYKVTRHYGGPEEGGWWYDRHEFVKQLAVTEDTNDAILIAQALNAKMKEEKRQPSGLYQGRYSVANHTDTVYYTEGVPKAHDDTNDPRPHYE